MFDSKSIIVLIFNHKQIPFFPYWPELPIDLTEMNEKRKDALSRQNIRCDELFMTAWR